MSCVFQGCWAAGASEAWLWTTVYCFWRRRQACCMWELEGLYMPCRLVTSPAALRRPYVLTNTSALNYRACQAEVYWYSWNILFFILLPLYNFLQLFQQKLLKMQTAFKHYVNNFSVRWCLFLVYANFTLFEKCGNLKFVFFSYIILMHEHCKGEQKSNYVLQYPQT